LLKTHPNWVSFLVILECPSSKISLPFCWEKVYIKKR
jgi:hypothetical protein